MTATFVRAMLVSASIVLSTVSCTDIEANSTYLEQKTDDRKVTVDEGLRLAAARMNEATPIMIDEDERLDSVSVGDNRTLIHNFSFPKVEKADFQLENWKVHAAELLKHRVCEPGRFDIFLRQGATMRYVYRDSNGEVLTEFSFTGQDCK